VGSFYGCLRLPGAIAGRDGFEVQIFGMDGIPEDDLRAHEREVLSDRDGNEKRLKMLQMMQAELEEEEEAVR